MIMKWSFLKQFLNQEESDANIKRDGYISFLPKPGILIQVRATRDNEYYTATYFQTCYDEDDKDYFLAIQLEGLPEDPFSSSVLSGFDEFSLRAKIYNEIVY